MEFSAILDFLLRHQAERHHGDNLVNCRVYKENDGIDHRLTICASDTSFRKAMLAESVTKGVPHLSETGPWAIETKDRDEEASNR